MALVGIFCDRNDSLVAWLVLHVTSCISEWLQLL